MTMREFTGERFIPGQVGAVIAYEHLHHYAFASRWARGMRVLDVATSSGCGAAVLAWRASGTRSCIACCAGCDCWPTNPA